MVWNNNQQMHGAPGKKFPSVCEEEDLPRFSTLQKATKRKYRKPIQAFEVYMIKSQTSNSPRKMCQDESMYHQITLCLSGCFKNKSYCV